MNGEEGEGKREGGDAKLCECVCVHLSERKERRKLNMKKRK